jgi:hypothetical protein
LTDSPVGPMAQEEKMTFEFILVEQVYPTASITTEPEAVPEVALLRQGEGLNRLT